MTPWIVKGSWAPVVGALALAVALSGCGGGSAGGARSSVRAGTSPASVAPPSAAPAGNSLAGSSATTTADGSAGGDNTGALLQAVDNDEQVASSASDQSDADFNAGVSAQAQNDDP